MNAASKRNHQHENTGIVLLTVAEVADLLRTSPKAVYAMAERGQIGGVTRIGRRLLFRRDLLIDFICQKSSAIAPREVM